MPERGHPDYLPNIRGRLYTAVLSDVLDGLGYRDQAMPPSIRPLDDALVMAGFARTGLYREIHRVVPDENPYELEIALVDDLKPTTSRYSAAAARRASRRGASCSPPRHVPAARRAA